MRGPPLRAVSLSSKHTRGYREQPNRSRGFFCSHRGRISSGGVGSESRFVERWEDLLPIAIRVGDSSAPIKLIEFADFECPFCRQYHGVLQSIQADYASNLELSFVHSPLPQHRFAIQSARVAECALAQGRFSEMQSELYAQQDSFGLRPWSAYAAAVGIPDMGRFNACAADTVRVDRIQKGIDASSRLRIPGTPTLVVNGWLRTGLPPDALRSLIDSLLREMEEQ